MRLGLHLGLPQCGGGLSVLTLLKNLTNLSFFKDFANSQASINADYSLGSGTATMTAARDATHPASYVDGKGLVVITTTANVPRYQGGYYDRWGFSALKGLMIEGADTNLVPASSSPSSASWTVSGITPVNADAGSTAPDGTATVPSLTATGTNGTLLLTAAVTGSTFSIWLKRKTGSSNVQITADGGATYATFAVDTTWRRFSVTAASANQTAGVRITASGDAVYMWGAQFETSPFPTSYIPTTAGALSRAAETLKYANTSNRTAGTESIFIKFATNWNCNEPTGSNRLLASDTKDRAIHFNASTDLWEGYANKTDSATNTAAQTYKHEKNKVQIASLVVQHASPYTRVSKNAVSQGTYTGGDFIDPAWGTSFYIGSDNAGANQLQGVIQSIAIYVDAKSTTVQSQIANILSFTALPNKIKTVQKFRITSQATAVRVRMAEQARNYIIVRNLEPTNVCEIAFTAVTNDNRNPASSGFTAINPGQEWYDTGTTNQVWVRAAVANAACIIEVETEVPIS